MIRVQSATMHEVSEKHIAECVKTLILQDTSVDRRDIHVIFQGTPGKDLVAVVFHPNTKQAERKP